MKILIVRTFPNMIDTHQYNVQEIGLAKALTRQGYQCGIVLYNGKCADSVENIPVVCDNDCRDITIYRLHGFNILKNGFFPSLNKVVGQYDIIQVHEYDQITSWLLYSWSKKKKVVIYHGPYYHEFNKGYNFKCKIFDSLFLKVKHNRDVLCMTKSSLATDFLKSKGFKSVRTVGVGLDLDNFAVNSEEELPIDSTKKNVIYVGKIEERRNSLFLLDVMKELRRRNQEVNCIIVGNGEEEYKSTFLTKAHDMMAEGYLQYYEKATQGQLAKLYETARVMLFPSNYEIFGMVLLEAVYFGLPVLTSKNGGADIFEDEKCSGIIVSGFKVEEWVEKAEEILIKNVGEKLTLKEREDLVSWDNKVPAFIECYNYK